MMMGGKKKIKNYLLTLMVFLLIIPSFIFYKSIDIDNDYSINRNSNHYQEIELFALGDRIIDFQIGANHCGVLIQKNDGTQEIWMWGDNSYGQLGFNIIGDSYYPQKAFETIYPVYSFWNLQTNNLNVFYSISSVNNI